MKGNDSTDQGKTKHIQTYEQLSIRITLRIASHFRTRQETLNFLRFFQLDAVAG